VVRPSRTGAARCRDKEKASHRGGFGIDLPRLATGRESRTPTTMPFIELRYRSLPFIVGVVLFLASSATCALLVLRSGITRHA
jgi:hypothetical protein